MVFLFKKQVVDLKFKDLGIFFNLFLEDARWGMQHPSLLIGFWIYFLYSGLYKKEKIFHWLPFFLVKVRSVFSRHLFDNYAIGFDIPFSYIYIPKSQTHQQLQIKSPSSSLTILFSPSAKYKRWHGWNILIVFLWKIMKLPLRYTICHNCIFSQE